MSNPTTLEFPPIAPEGVIVGEDGAPSALPPAPLTLTEQAVHQTLHATGARVGLFWIAVIAIAAIFAPFIANSQPLILKMNGNWTSPALTHLTPADVILLIGFFAAVILWFAPLERFRQKAAILALVIAVAIPLASWRVVADSLSTWVADWKAGPVYSVLILCGLLDVAVLALIGAKLKISWRSTLVVAMCLAPLVALLVAFPVRPPLTVVYDRYRMAQREGRVQFILHAPIAYSPNDALSDQGDMSLVNPSSEHLMGTDLFGQDLASRMIHASRIALSIGFISTGIAVVIGLLIGGVMGYVVGWVDLFGMRLIEVFDAIPTIFLLITVVAFFGHNLYIIMAVIGLTSWSGYARFIRAEFLRLRKQDFVHAARAAGLPVRSILFRHMLPNGLSPVLVSVSFGVAGAILTEATLSFLGLGLIDEPSWGQLLNQALGSGGAFYWWIALYPGLAIFLTVLAYNLVGEALRDALDPKLRTRE